MSVQTASMTFYQALPYIYALLKDVESSLAEKSMALALIVYADSDLLPPSLHSLQTGPAGTGLRNLVEQLIDHDSVTPAYARSKLTEATALLGVVNPTDEEERLLLSAFIADGAAFYKFLKKVVSAENAARGANIDIAGNVSGALVNLGHLEVGRDLILSMDLPPETKALIHELKPKIDAISLQIAQGFQETQGVIRRNRTLVIVAQALVMLAVVIGVTGGVIGLIQSNPSIGICLPFLAPHKMESGGLNVLVPGFSSVDRDGMSVDAEDADRKNSVIAGEIAQIETLHVRSFKDCAVGRIETPGLNARTSEAVKMRREQAKAFAARHGADIVIYGVVTNYAQSIVFMPEIYIAPSFATTQPELIESEMFAQPITVPRGPTSAVGFSNYAKLLRGFIDGIDQFVTGRYKEAETSFITARDTFLNAVKNDESIDPAIRSGKGLEIFYIMAGNAASRQNNCRTALGYYSLSLVTRPTYARGLLGRGQSFFNCAGELYRAQAAPPAFDAAYTLPGNTQCRDAPPTYEQLEPLMAMAVLCTNEAEQSTDYVEVADMDVKIPYRRAQMQSWLADRQYGADWQTVITLMEQVTSAYEASDADRQNRLLVIAARSYETLGKAYTRLACVEPGNQAPYVEKAIANYEKAQAAFEGYTEVMLSREHLQLIADRIRRLTEIQQTDISPCTLNLVAVPDS